jgi:hypothetical protein
MPDMEYQRLLGGYIPGLIDPTCGRYCLKSLLKYWHEKKEGGSRATRLAIAKPTSGWGNWIGYDAYDDYPHAKELLVESGEKPSSVIAWHELLTRVGPIILAGNGLGAASSWVGHYILLVGVDTDSKVETFYYLDPLVGNVLKKAAWEPMQNRIEACLVYAQSDISRKLDRSNRYFTVTR